MAILKIIYSQSYTAPSRLPLLRKSLCCFLRIAVVSTVTSLVPMQTAIFSFLFGDGENFFSPSPNKNEKSGLGTRLNCNLHHVK